MKKTVGLVLEGGGMKGIYTAGVLDVFMEENLYFPYVIGVSAGACQATSYVSKQIGRNKNTILRFIDHPRYISRKNLILKGSIMDMDFIFNEIPNKYEWFDYETYFGSEMRCIFVVTDCQSGKAVYIDGKQRRDKEFLADAVRASSSLPLLTKSVLLEGKPAIDGGMSDSIPLRKSIADGNWKNVVVLTKPQGYRKKPSVLGWLYKKKYKAYPKLVNTLLQRHLMYNETMDYIERMEREERIIVIRPSQDLHVSRMEKNKKKLESLYELGYRDAKEKLNPIKQYIAGV